MVIFYKDKFSHLYDQHGGANILRQTVRENSFIEIMNLWSRSYELFFIHLISIMIIKQVVLNTTKIKQNINK